jgi:hypothetical protein
VSGAWHHMAKDKDGLYRSIRGPHGVGKVLGRNKWVHASALPALSAPERALVGKALQAIQREKGIEIDFRKDVVIKINPAEKGGAVTFCYSPDWKTATEPECGPMIGVTGLAAGPRAFRVSNPPADPYVYHHKWMFVDDDYRGFNVPAAKRWSETWENSPVVRALCADKTEHFRLRIGKKDYWQENVLAPLGKRRK